MVVVQVQGTGAINLCPINTARLDQDGSTFKERHKAYVSTVCSPKRQH